MRICLAQTKIAYEDKIRNFKTAEKRIEEASLLKSDIILFPEMSFTGFSMNTELIGEEEEETVKLMAESAIKYGISIGFGWVKKTGDCFQNQYTILGNDGNRVTEYTKIHPFSFSEEDKFYKAGEDLAIFKLKDMKMAVFICYDLRFPELFRAVCGEVSLIVIPANWPSKRSEHWKTLLRARAIENQVYIIAVNCQGEMNNQYYSGDSCIINPNGNIIRMLSDNEGLIQYDITDDVEMYRKVFPVLKDRRTELYKRLMQNV